MKKTVLFNELNLRYPESFDVMSEEELGKVFSCRAERWGIKNLEQHMMFSVTRSGGKGILSRITDSKAVASGAGHQMKKNADRLQKSVQHRSDHLRSKGARLWLFVHAYQFRR